MEKKTTILDEETKQHIQEMSKTMAEKMAEDAPPDPLHPKELLKKQLQIEMQTKITEFFERFVIGVKELVFNLIKLSENEPELYSDEIVAQMDKLGEGLESLGENPDETRSPREVCGLTNDTMKAFNRAVADLYENKQYEKSSAVYSFLSFLDPDEPAYWLGYGNSEYFCKRYENALRAYESAAIMDPGDPHCHLYSAHCHNELNQVDLALESVDKALEIIKKDPAMKEWEEPAEQLKLYLGDMAKKH